MEHSSKELSVFISYARADGSAFAEELVAGLETAGFDPFLDRQDIAAGEDWEVRLGHLLDRADTVVYVISPAFVASERCAWEVERALNLNKRIIPLVLIEVPEADTPENLRKLNYIYFSKPNSFGPGLRQLAEALRTDIDWVREHTRLAELGGRWKEQGSSDALLLRGTELSAAQGWLKDWSPGAPQPTDLHRTFIAASEALEQRDNSKEAQRLAEIASAQEEKAQALKRMSRANMAWGAVSTLLLAAIAAGAVYLLRLYDQSQAASELAAEAIVARKQAERRNNELNESFLQTREQLETVMRELEESQQVSFTAPPEEMVLMDDMTPDMEPLSPDGETGDADSYPPPPPVVAGPVVTAPSVPEKKDTYDSELQKARVALGWDLDIFWCAGANGELNRKRGLEIENLLLSEQQRQLEQTSESVRRGEVGDLSWPIGRIRLRELAEKTNQRKGYAIGADVIRAEAKEQGQGRALAGFLNTNVGADIVVQRSTQSTPYYLSVFMCAG